MIYKYVAYAPTGEQVAGSVDAASEEVAERTLWDWQYKVVLLRPVRPRPRLDQVIPSLFGVKPSEVITFSRQLATLVESGIALLPAIELLQDQSGGVLARVLGEMTRDIKNGSPFSAAIAQHPDGLPSPLRSPDGSRRTDGKPGGGAASGGDPYRERAGAGEEVRGAMAYPAFMVVLAIVVVGILVTTALPPLLGLFDEFNAQLPLPTRILLAVSGFATTYKIHMLVAAIAVAVGATWYLRQPAGRRQLDFVLARCRSSAPINVQANVSRFSRTIAMLLRAGPSPVQHNGACPPDDAEPDHPRGAGRRKGRVAAR